MPGGVSEQKGHCRFAPGRFPEVPQWSAHRPARSLVVTMDRQTVSELELHHFTNTQKQVPVGGAAWALSPPNPAGLCRQLVIQDRI